MTESTTEDYTPEIEPVAPEKIGAEPEFTYLQDEPELPSLEVVR